MQEFSEEIYELEWTNSFNKQVSYFQCSCYIEMCSDFVVAAACLCVFSFCLFAPLFVSF